MSTFLVMASRMLRLSWRAACFSNRFCHPKFSSNTKEGLLFTGALAVPVDNLNRRFRCNRSLISCKQFTAIKHSLPACSRVRFSPQTFEQKKKQEKKKVIVDVQRILNTAKQRRLTRLLVLIRRHTQDKNRRVQNLPVKKFLIDQSLLTKQRRCTRLLIVLRRHTRENNYCDQTVFYLYIMKP